MFSHLVHHPVVANQCAAHGAGYDKDHDDDDDDHYDDNAEGKVNVIIMTITM